MKSIKSTAGWISIQKMNWIWVTLVICLQLGTTAVEGQHRSPKITEHPKDVLVTKNEPTTLNCKAEGKPDPIIEWYKNGELLGPSSEGRRIFLPFGDLFFLSVSDGRRKDFGPDGSKESDSGIYWCIARNSVGSVRSRNATLQVGVIRDEFRQLPQHAQVLVGETTKLSCQPPRGTPEPQILWHRNGQTVDTRLGSSRFQIVDGGNLLIKDVKAADAGRFQCVAVNIAGTRTTPEVTLSVDQKPYFKTEPNDVTVLVGDSAIFNCEVDGIPTPSIDWYRQDSQMPKDRVDRIVGGLRIRDTRPEDEGLYFCQSTNQLGSVRSAANLNVHSHPKFIVLPRDQRVGINEEAKFECSANGSPVPLVYWRKSRSQELFLPFSTSEHVSVSPEGVLRVDGVRKEDLGTYICSAVSPAGSTELTVRLELTSGDQFPPPIINVGPRNQTLPLKSMVNFPCETTGHGTSTNPTIIKWLKDGKLILADEIGEQSKRFSITLNGTLQVNDLRSLDSGSYICVASSLSGTTSASAYLLVESPTNPNIAFHRSNPSFLPLPPSKPILNESTSTSLTLSWIWMQKQAPARNSPLLGFTLEVFNLDDEGEKKWKILGKRLYGGGSRSGEILYTVEGLIPDSRYIFLVRAENPEGLSPVSPVSDIIRTRPTYRKPSSSTDIDEVDEEDVRTQLSMTEIQLITVEAASSISIRNNWKVSKASLKFVDGYYIRYREIFPSEISSSSIPFSLITVVAQKTDTYSHIISNLKKWTQYEVFVSPFYKSVEGQPSNSRIVITSEDRPSAPPQGLVTKIINSTAALLRWSPPPPTHSNGILTGYRVEVRRNDTRLQTELDVGSNTTLMIINNLTLGRLYFIRVSAFTNIGEGPFSPPLSFSMDSLTNSGTGEGVNGSSSSDGSSTTTTSSSEILKEVWFIILMGCLLFLFLLLLIIILYSRRKSHGKKDHISSVVLAPHNTTQFTTGKQSLWIDQRWGPSDTGDKDSSRSKTKLLTNHHLNPTEPTDYAEVDPHNLTTFYNNSSTCHNGSGKQLVQLQQPDLTPYATTTLIQQRRPNYDPLPMNGGVPLAKNLGDSYRDSDQFSSGRSKLSFGSNNFNKFKSSHPSPSPSPSVPLKLIPKASRLGCYPSPGPNRSHPSTQSDQLPNSLYHQYSSGGGLHNPHATENLYHIGEIFNPNKSASANNGFAEAVYQSGDPDEDSHFLSQQQNLFPLIDREIQSSLPSLASDSNSCNLYAEADDVIPQTTSNNYILNSSGNRLQSGCGGPSVIKNSRSSSPAYSSSDSFNSGKSGSKRLYNKGTSSNKKKFETSCKSLERRHLTPLLPGRTDESSTPSYNRGIIPHQSNGFQKFSRFNPTPRIGGVGAISQNHLVDPNNATEYHTSDWQSNDSNVLKLAQTLKESNA